MKAFLPKYLFSAFALLAAGLLPAQHAVAQSSQTFTSSGTFNLPNGVTSITVEAWGGGAGGNANVYGGGGGGAYSRITISNPLSSYTVTIGAGGAAGANGGNTTFGAALTANGGQAGSGGAASTGAGITSFRGGNGGGGTTNSGGGAGASAAGAGADAVGSAGGVGVAPGGSGGNGSATTNGQPGSVYGGGGGSRGSGGGSGAGAPGQVIVTWTVCSTITASAAKTDVTCFNSGNGTIIVTASGGTSPYNYSINNGSSYQAGNTFSTLGVGSYQIRVRDVNGCTSASVQ